MKGDDPLWIVAARSAVGDIDGEIRINVAGNSVSSSILDILDSHTKAAPDSAYVTSEMVRISRLDSIGATYIDKTTHNVFLKIDAQGFERQVLEGAQGILSKVRGIQLELSLVPLYRGQALFKELLDKLDSLGFDLCDVSPAFIDEEKARLLQIDGVFFRRDG
jgi:FkbM family methyltransferase